MTILLCLLRVSFSLPLENLELEGRHAGLYEGDMRLTPYQAFMNIESGAGDVRGSIITKKWRRAVLVYNIDSSLSKLYDFSDEFSLITITSSLPIILFFSFFLFFHSTTPITQQ